MQDLRRILKQYWGFDQFRPLQEEAILSILNGDDVLALMPTAAGKSVCYQLPALMLEGVCLVISPLVALMQDQVARLQQRGIAAVAIHAGLHYREVERTLREALDGQYKLVYISPERLQTRLFRQYLPELEVSFIAVDEAHCVSQWGHDFRPDYLRIARLRELFPKAPVMALTASAPPDIQQDMALQLKLRRPVVLKQSFARNNIFFEMRYSENKIGDTLQELGQARGPCIVYCRSRKQTDHLTKTLSTHGIKVAGYHAGMSRERRLQAQQQWMEDHIQVMVATTAFGMGIDKPDVRLVLHYDLPEDPESYYQEAGRAGRDGKQSLALTLYDTGDLKRLEASTEAHFPPEAFLRKMYQAVCEYLQLPVGTEPDRYFRFEIVEFCKRFGLPAAPAARALRLLEQEGLWTLTEAAWQPATLQLLTDRQGIDQTMALHPGFGYLLTSLLRHHGGLFYHPATVTLAAIARQAKMRQDETLQQLGQLQAMDILEYRPATEGPMLYVHHLRVDSRHLLIDRERIHRLRTRHRQRVEAMIQLACTKDLCRERYLLQYFGEQSEAYCGHCDVCRRRMPMIAPDKLREHLIELITRLQPVSLEQLIAEIPIAEQGPALSCLRVLMDERIILRDEEGKLRQRNG